MRFWPLIFIRVASNLRDCRENCQTFILLLLIVIFTLQFILKDSQVCHAICSNNYMHDCVYKNFCCYRSIYRFQIQQLFQIIYIRALELHITLKFIIKVKRYYGNTCLGKYMYGIITVRYLKVALNYISHLYLNNGQPI